MPRPGREGRARIEVVQGVPVLHLFGSPEEMGRAHGVLLREQFGVLRDAYLHQFIGSGVARDGFLFAAARFAEHLPEPYAAEMRALAKGAGAPYPDALLVNTFLDVSRATQCSVVMAAGEAAQGGTLLFARNTDWPTLGIADKASLLVVYHHEAPRVHSFVAVGWPGMVGVISGMNDAGLCVATLVSLTESGAQPGVPYAMMYRQILECCTTPQEALELVKATRRTCANNLAVAGPTGEPLVIEFSPTKVAARSPRRGVLLATNHFRAPDFVATPNPLDGRYGTLERMTAEKHGRRDVAALKDMLRAVGMSGMCLQAMVFEPAARRLHLSIGRVPATDGPYGVFDCARLLESK